MNIKIPDHVRGLMDRIEAAGHEAFAVGGSLRDALLGIPPHDWDVTTSALPETVASLFPDKHVIPTGLQHGTVTVVADGDPVEITTYRVDGEYTDSRRPDEVRFTTSIEDDLSRRDFTVNAMAYSDKRGLVDLFGGRDDLEKKIIRAVGDPEKRFTEDALRIMRAFRFSAQLDFEIENNTLAAAIKLGGRLKNIARERIGSEFMRLLSSVAAGRALTTMGGVLGEIIPWEIPAERLTLVDKLPRDSEARLALLLHGAPREAILDTAHALRLSNEQKKRLAAMSQSSPVREITPPACRRFLRTLGEDAPSAARILALLGLGERELEDALIEESAKSPCLSVGALAINGTDLITEGIASGRAVGELLSSLLDSVIDAPSINERDTLLELARDLASH